jgi:SAM-dependent methyltransferase
MTWWQTFFDADYLTLWGGASPAQADAQQADGLWHLLRLRAGDRLLDAPCGYGRLSRLLALRGVRVLGVDQSAALLSAARRRSEGIDPASLRYLEHDLRMPLPETGFDAAINVYTSLGYGTQADDLAILQTLHQAVRPAGLVLVETLHREAALAALQAGLVSHHLPDGTILTEEPSYDAASLRMQTRWSWSGPAGTGRKLSSVRLYTPDELAQLLEQAGLAVRSLHADCTPEPFVATGRKQSPRVGIVALRPR